MFPNNGLHAVAPGEAAWDSFVQASPDAHFLQTCAWGALKAEFGWRASRVALADGGSIVAGAQILYRTFLPRLTLAYIPGGPLVNWEDPRSVDALLAALNAEMDSHSAFCLKFEPEFSYSADFLTRLSRYGIVSSRQHIQPRASIVIDLCRGEEEILAGMPQKTRYNIRLAQRKEVEVYPAEIAQLGVFYQLMDQTGNRDGFATYSEEYYRRLLELFSPIGCARLFLAAYQGEILAGVIVVTAGRKAWSLYTASGSAHRDRMPNYLLQWEGMRWARAKGCTTYDLWGIPDEVGLQPMRYAKTEKRRTHGLWGVYGFKRSFGGQVIWKIGACDFPRKRWLYGLYSNAIQIPELLWGETWHRRFRAG